ncbi:unnamed protein product [Rotaria sp. Silwood1]|nr:unnamed protein product [Rotaria sp. Silwood1]CAF4826394.1 unnamed protein product [Rotaria sp. Silwood1]
MGQHLSTSNSQIFDLLKLKYSTINSAEVISCIDPEDIHLFLSPKIHSDRITDQYNNDNKQQSSITSTLSALIKSAEKLVSSKIHLSHASKTDSSSSNDRNIEKQLEINLRKFLNSKVSFKEILSVLNQLLFDIHYVYDLRNIFS